MKIIYYGRELREKLKIDYGNIYHADIYMLRQIIKNPNDFIHNDEHETIKEGIFIKEFGTAREYLAVKKILDANNYVVIEDMPANIISKTYDLETDTLKIYTEYTFKIHPGKEGERDELKERIIEMAEQRLDQKVKGYKGLMINLK
ncbi:hypothetical protein ACI3ER_11605 [Bacillus sp. Wb]